MEEQLKGTEDAFTDIYIYDKDAKERVQSLIESKECIDLVNKAKAMGSTLLLLDELIPDKKVRPFTRFRSAIKPFDDRSEYRTKEDYLQYLKYAYGFMMSPMEIPPGRILSLFFPGYRRSWSPSQDSAIELLKRFYAEVRLISELSPSQWEEVVKSTNPEGTISKLLYGTEFKPDFEEFLRRIPWIMSWDAYGTPGLDLMYRRAPGHEMPKKPFGVGDSFFNNLVRSSLSNQIHTVLVLEEERIKLTAKSQITDQIKAEGSATIDSFIGLSKIERDFVIHQRIIIWQNPGFKKYQRSSLFHRLRYAKPSRFLCLIREDALPLEIPFLERKFERYRR